MSFRQALENYFIELAAEQRFTVPETSHYSLLRNLLNAVGAELQPQVRAYVHPANTGAGIPDIGLFAESQEEGQKPAHGVIEAKPIRDNINTIAQSAQVVSQYIPHYGQVLATNFYQFMLVTTNGSEESYKICETEADFLQQIVLPHRLAEQHAHALREYLLRVLRRSVPLSEPRDVAWILASYAREAKARIAAGGADLSALDHVREQLEKALGVAFDLEAGQEFFRSTLVQTLFYGIFSAWVLWHENGKPDGSFQLWRHIRDLNVPAVQELFEQITIPSRLRPLNIEQVLEWTAKALNRVHETFFDKFNRGAAIQYFYEPFLEAFDPDLRRQLGVWYTPPQVVEYMVARVDKALREELNIEDGLLNDSVYVLDPCCGTGAYLVEVLRHIHRTAASSEGKLMAGQAVLKALVTQRRIFGFELLPAPFVIAHLQVGMLLREMQAPLPQQERAGIYLTNALTGWDDQPTTKIMFPSLARERDAAQTVKRQQPILVILGNPPYSGYAGVAVNEERDLSDAYRTTERAPRPQGQGLNDPYVRFFRMAERKIVEQTQRGIVCYISNYSWLDGLSHPGMRERYLNAFDSIYVDNLHGDRIISEYAPDGNSSETIFAMRGTSPGIRIGTAIATLVRKQNHQTPAAIYYRDRHEARAEARRAALLESLTNAGMKTGYQQLEPNLRLGYPFKPRTLSANYLEWAKLPDLFPASFPGVQTKRDELVVDIDKNVLAERMKAYFDPRISHEEMRRICSRAIESTNSAFHPLTTRETLQAKGFSEDRIVPFCYRPFDKRWIYYEQDTDLLQRKSPDFFRNVKSNNIWIEARRRIPTETFDRGYFVQILADNFGNGFSNYYPLYLYDEQLGLGGEFSDNQHGNRRENINPKAAQYLQSLNSSAESLFYHALAVMHASTYRAENAGALRQDWPRIPLPPSADLLEASANCGKRIAALLDVEKAVAGVTTGSIQVDLQPVAILSTGDNSAPDFAVTAWGYMANGATMPGNGTISTNDDGTVNIYLNPTTYWANIPQAVWDYTLGGYPVLKKWLSYRDKRVLERDLRPEEAREFMHIARRITAILALESALDDNYRAVSINTYQWNE